MNKRKTFTKEELRAYAGQPISDVIAPNLKVLFCGINPGLYSAATGYHFARPGNRFWPALYAAGFTPAPYTPAEEMKLLELGYGITNVVARSTATAAEISKAEFTEGGVLLRKRVLHYRPKWLAVVGIQAFRLAFDRPGATVGPQPESIGDTAVWVLPNPSGLNAHYTPARFAEVFRELRLAAETS